MTKSEFYRDLIFLHKKTGQGICTLKRFIYTTGLVIGLDEFGYKGRYCYDNLQEAIVGITLWDGTGYPPGKWIKYKGEGGEISKSTLKENMKTFEIWMEGYAATGESSGAQLLGTFKADNFDEAIILYEQEMSEKEGKEFKVERYEGTQATRSKYGIWACRLFDNEEEARKGFG